MPRCLFRSTTFSPPTHPINTHFLSWGGPTDSSATITKWQILLLCYTMITATLLITQGEELMLNGQGWKQSFATSHFFFLYPWPLITTGRAGSSLNMQLENMRVNFHHTCEYHHSWTYRPDRLPWAPWRAYGQKESCLHELSLMNIVSKGQMWKMSENLSLCVQQVSWKLYWYF